MIALDLIGLAQQLRLALVGRSPDVVEVALQSGLLLAERLQRVQLGLRYRLG